MKQRIVGAVIIVSLGIILVPMVLNQKDVINIKNHADDIPVMPDNIKRTISLAKNTIPKAEHMPTMPYIDAVPVDEVNVDLIKQQGKKIVTSYQYVNDDKKEASLNPYQHAYVIQVASFSMAKNADELKAKLLEKKFHVYMEMQESKEGRYYRVRVGPFLRKEQAKTQQEALMLQVGLMGKIIDLGN